MAGEAWGVRSARSGNNTGWAALAGEWEGLPSRKGSEPTRRTLGGPLASPGGPPGQEHLVTALYRVTSASNWPPHRSGPSVWPTDQHPALPGCVTLCKSLHLSEPVTWRWWEFPHWDPMGLKPHLGIEHGGTGLGLRTIKGAGLESTRVPLAAWKLGREPQGPADGLLAHSSEALPLWLTLCPEGHWDHVDTAQESKRAARLGGKGTGMPDACPSLPP